MEESYDATTGVVFDFTIDYTDSVVGNSFLSIVDVIIVIQIRPLYKTFQDEESVVSNRQVPHISIR